MMSKSYNHERDIKNTQLLQNIQRSLPSYMRGFFLYLTATRNLSTLTALGYARDLEVFCYFMTQTNPAVSSPESLTTDMLDSLNMQDISEYLAFLKVYTRDGVQYSNEETGRARKLSALKSFWKWALGAGVLRNNPTALIPSPKSHKKEIVYLEKDEAQTVLHGAITGDSLTEGQRKASQNLALRDVAIIALLLGTGIRVSECVGIDMPNIDFKTDSVLIIRKGGNEERKYFNQAVKGHILDYIQNERIKPKDKADPLFVSREGTRLSVRSVERLIRKYSVSAVPGKKITPHRLRATYGTQLYRASRDIRLTADAMGHRNMNTTCLYVNTGDESEQQAVQITEKIFETTENSEYSNNLNT